MSVDFVNESFISSNGKFQTNFVIEISNRFNIKMTVNFVTKSFISSNRKFQTDFVIEISNASNTK